MNNLGANLLRETACPESRKGSNLKFLTYNILYGGRGHEAEVYDIIGQQHADVILLQEVTNQEFVGELAARLHYNFFVAESNGWLTLALVTRFPIREQESFHPGILRHTCLQATLEYAPRSTLTLFGIHLAAPAYTLPLEIYRLLELRLILKKMRETRAENIVMAGDFNSIAAGDTPDFRHLPFSLRLSMFFHGGYIARQVIATVRAQGFTDVFRILHPNENGYTLPAIKPNTRLDYIFISNALRAGLRTCDVVTTPDTVKRASDHLPVSMELAL